MKSFVLTTLIFAGISQIGVQSQENEKEDHSKIKEKWFEQYLDHFSAWDNRTFPMRYFENDEFYKPGGPLLLEICGEMAADPSLLRWSPSRSLAQKLNGRVVLLEHRYYGKSSPFDNFTTENLVYLNVEQVLEDLAYFVESYRKTTPGIEHCKVAVFGCSYSGVLATWFRYKFPHLVDAAWASSAPLRVTLDFYQFYEVVGEIYSNVSTECIAIIRQGYREAKQMMSSAEGEEKVKAIFEGWECGNVTEMDSNEILDGIRMVVGNQYSKPSHGIESCKFLQSKNATTTCFQQLAAFVLDTAKETCFDDDPNDTLAWFYQTCTQFGYSFTMTSCKQPFKDSISVIDEDLENCASNFREEFNNKYVLQRSIDRINRVYGGVNLKVTKVITITGAQDPWHKMALQQRPNKDAPVFFVSGASHCSDMREMEEPEPPQLIEAKAKGLNIMIQWLQ